MAASAVQFYKSTHHTPQVLSKLRNNLAIKMGKDSSRLFYMAISAVGILLAGCGARSGNANMLFSGFGVAFMSSKLEADTLRDKIHNYTTAFLQVTEPAYIEFADKLGVELNSKNIFNFTQFFHMAKSSPFIQFNEDYSRLIENQMGNGRVSAITEEYKYKYNFKNVAIFSCFMLALTGLAVLAASYGAPQMTSQTRFVCQSAIAGFGIEKILSHLQNYMKFSKAFLDTRFLEFANRKYISFRKSDLDRFVDFFNFGVKHGFIKAEQQ